MSDAVDGNADVPVADGAETARARIDRQEVLGVGLNAVELAARRGIGPLSPLGHKAWHGEAKPCVSCGQLIRRTSSVCELCGQDLSPQMLVKMQRYSGPWYVLEHVRPFPGVSLDRLVLQARRGVLTATTIVRGPTTFHQWRFAGETPGLSKYVGVCWQCQSAVTEHDSSCPICRVNLDSGTDVLIEQARPEVDPVPSAGSIEDGRPASAGTAGPLAHTQDELGRLGAAATTTGGPDAARSAPAPTTVAGIRVHWIVLGLLVLLVVVVYMVVRIRASQTTRQESDSRQTVSVTSTFGYVASTAFKG